MTEDACSRDADAGTLPAWHIFLLFLRLGLTSFGGPAAHLGFFHEEFVKRRQWLSDSAYGEVVALCQLLPGPASSQVGLTLGFLQRGYRGAAAAWLGFTLPSALLMTLFALGLGLWPEAGEGGWIAGLKLFVVAVVAQAVWQMGRSLCPDGPRLSIAVLVAVLLLTVGATWMQILALLAAGAAGAALKLPQKQSSQTLTIPVQTRRPMAFFAVFAVLLVLAFLPLASGSPGWIWAELYRAGALVFGGGHVVLPWLQEGFVASGAMPADTFLAGYGVAQAMPGPLFSFSAFLGGIQGGWAGAVVAVIAVFLPGTLLVFAGLPLWSYIRSHELARAALAGVNAGVVGLLLAALYDPVFTSAVHSSAALAFVMLAWVSLAIWRVPVWVLAPLSALAGLLLF
ncbi:chromate efflux transporter [Marinobacter orientalis]|uniref:Chromate efflux transporter n=1 Tax=Marinobacter orientalis TaxID=1928859 RepID=A0A7Y0NKR9_9GAMM|nr:chromate efflux transporter [Marinobacter orientalis]NMT62288.1 chromate efflux transporter [Marinobacter orientalis]TGX50999.1 chromate efflux transporter [Marinobacter orientalis]